MYVHGCIIFLQDRKLLVEFVKIYNLLEYPMAILWHTMASGDFGQMSTSVLELHGSYICGKPFQITNAIFGAFLSIFNDIFIYPHVFQECFLNISNAFSYELHILLLNI